MGWVIFFLLCICAVSFFYKSAKVGYQTKDGFFFGVQKQNNKEQDHEKK